VVDGLPRRVGIRRIHLEEDAGKLLHDPQEPSSYVDFNRTGVPLLEIVSEPDLHSPEEAYQYLLELKAVLEYLDVSTCNMEEGSLRCDANISLRPVGARELGSKVEIKNMNSFKAVKAALEHETARQAKLLQQGSRIPQETRLWDAKSETTETMRSKEEASDYRYFPEPDLVPFVIEERLGVEVAKGLPELPAQRRKRLAEAYGLSAYDAQVLTQHRTIAGLFEEAVARYPNPKPVANWIMGELLGYLNARGKEPEALVIEPLWIVHLLEALDNGTLSGTMAKALFIESLDRQADPQSLIEERNLRQIVDDGVLDRLADEVIAGFPKSVQDYRRGKGNALMFLVGKCMERSQGKANPQQVTEILRRKLTAETEGSS
jgi:aspartyl-tRNA(Asn)/glutamyl-tRNA(Gln) amidotransferase subunit B